MHVALVKEREREIKGRLAFFETGEIKFSVSLDGWIRSQATETTETKPLLNQPKRLNEQNEAKSLKQANPL